MRNRLIAVAATALIPAVGLLTYNEFASRRQREAEIHLQAAQAARTASSEVDRIIEGARSLLIAVSAIPAVADLDRGTCSATLRRVADRLVQTGAILVIDSSKKLVCDSQGNLPGTDFSDRPYVNEGMTASDIVIGEYTVSKLSGRAVLPVALPLRSNGKTIGVVATGIRLSWLQERIVERGLLAGGAVTIADRKGVILARSPDSARFVGKRWLGKFEQPG